MQKGKAKTTPQAPKTKRVKATAETIERQRDKLLKAKAYHETHLRRTKQKLDALDKKAGEVEAQQLVDWIREKNISYSEAMRLLNPQAES